MRTITIEILYEEFNNLYGDSGNIDYLKEKLKKSKCNIKIVQTHLYDVPLFTTDNKVDLLYIGPCTEKSQLLELSELRRYTEAIKERIYSDYLTLVTGNALELFGKYIQTEQGERFEALGIFDYYAQRFERFRFNDICLGDHQDIQITGFKNQLSHCYGENSSPFVHMTTGTGLNPQTKEEGIHIGSFYATYLLGPILPLNPQFTHRLLAKMLGEDYIANPLPFEQTAYDIRIDEIKNSGRIKSSQ